MRKEESPALEEEKRPVVEEEKRADVGRHGCVDDFEAWWEERKGRLEESLQS